MGAGASAAVENLPETVHLEDLASKSSDELRELRVDEAKFRALLDEHKATPTITRAQLQRYATNTRPKHTHKDVVSAGGAFLRTGGEERALDRAAVALFASLARWEFSTAHRPPNEDSDEAAAASVSLSSRRKRDGVGVGAPFIELFRWRACQLLDDRVDAPLSDGDARLLWGDRHKSGLLRLASTGREIARIVGCFERGDLVFEKSTGRLGIVMATSKSACRVQFAHEAKNASQELLVGELSLWHNGQEPDTYKDKYGETKETTEARKWAKERSKQLREEDKRAPPDERDTAQQPTALAARIRFAGDRTEWLSSTDWLDADGCCVVELVADDKGAALSLEEGGSTTTITTTTSSSSSSSSSSKSAAALLRLRPTVLAYSGGGPGLRVALCSSIERSQCCGTVVAHINDDSDDNGDNDSGSDDNSDDGKISVRIDNSDKVVRIDACPATIVLAPLFTYEKGEHLLVVDAQRNGALRDVFVEEWCGAEKGARHVVRPCDAEDQEEDGTFEIDLNDVNHCAQAFLSLEAFERSRVAYCNLVLERGRLVEDAITGNHLDIEKQTLCISTDASVNAVQQKAEELAKMRPDDLRWISGADETAAAIAEGDRVRCANEHGVVNVIDPARGERCCNVRFDAVEKRWCAFAELEKAAPIMGVQLEGWSSIEDIRGLVPLLTTTSKLRSAGGHDAQPVLMRAGPGTGKTWSMQQLVFLLARRLNRSGAAEENAAAEAAAAAYDDPVPLAPLVIYVQKLTRMMAQLRTQIGEELSARRLSNLVLDYVRVEYADRDSERRFLEQAFQLRSLVVLLDGVDEAAGLKEMIEDFVHRALLPMGFRVVVTSRPEGVRLRLYARHFVIMNLKPLTAQQQSDAINKQLSNSEFYNHLHAFSTIRAHHDQLYKTEAFSYEQDRRSIEKFKKPDMFKSMRMRGAYNPLMRQMAVDGSRFVREITGAPQSEYLKALSLDERVLQRIDAVMSDMAPDVTGEEVRAATDGVMGSAPELEQKIAYKLALLVQKRQTAGTLEKDAMACTMWPTILARTDEIYQAAEKLLPVFVATAKSLLLKADLNPATDLLPGPLKDPVRIHEKAIDDYRGRFADGVIPEACVVDVVRCRIVCSTAHGMLMVQRLLDGFKVMFEGSPATLSLIRAKNKFAQLDPTHFRNILNNLQLSWRGINLFVEMQVHHREILSYNDLAHAHDHYNFFRAHLQDQYDTELDSALDFMLERRMQVFEIITTVPVLLSMLIVVLAAYQRGECYAALPCDLHELYTMAVRAVLQRRVAGDDMRALAMSMMSRIAVHNHLAECRTFYQSEIDDALAGDAEALALWHSLLQGDGGPPLIKVLTEPEEGDASQGEYQFKHISFQEALFVSSFLSSEADGFISTPEDISKRLNQSFFYNAFFIGRGHIGPKLSREFPEWKFTDSPLDDHGKKALVLLCEGVKDLVSLSFPLDSVDSAVQTHDVQPWYSSVQLSPDMLGSFRGGYIDCKWRDQGFGNQKGHLHGKVTVVSNDHDDDDDDDEGSDNDDDVIDVGSKKGKRSKHSYGKWARLTRDFAPHSNTPAPVRAPLINAWFDGSLTSPCVLELGYEVGGGGGHELHVASGGKVVFDMSEDTEPLLVALRVLRRSHGRGGDLQDADVEELLTPMESTGVAPLCALARNRARTDTLLQILNVRSDFTVRLQASALLAVLSPQYADLACKFLDGGVVVGEDVIEQLLATPEKGSSQWHKLALGDVRGVVVPKLLRLSPKLAETAPMLVVEMIQYNKNAAALSILRGLPDNIPELVTETLLQEMDAVTTTATTGIMRVTGTMTGRWLSNESKEVDGLPHAEDETVYIFAVHDDGHTKMAAWRIKSPDATPEWVDGRNYVDNLMPIDPSSISNTWDAAETQNIGKLDYEVANISAAWARRAPGMRMKRGVVEWKNDTEVTLAKPLAPGDSVGVQGTGGVSTLNLRQGPNTDILLHFNPRRPSGCVVRTTNYANQWGNEEREGGYPFKTNEEWEYELTVAEDGQSIKMVADGRDFGVFELRGGRTAMEVTTIVVDPYHGCQDEPTESFSLAWAPAGASVNDQPRVVGLAASGKELRVVPIGDGSAIPACKAYVDRDCEVDIDLDLRGNAYFVQTSCDDKNRDDDVYFTLELSHAADVWVLADERVTTENQPEWLRQDYTPGDRAAIQHNRSEKYRSWHRRVPAGKIAFGGADANGTTTFQVVIEYRTGEASCDNLFKSIIESVFVIIIFRHPIDFLLPSFIQVPSSRKLCRSCRRRLSSTTSSIASHDSPPKSPRSS